MNHVRYVLALLALAVGLPPSHGGDREPAKLHELMQRKLEHAQKVLEGVALNDFGKIAENAQDLIRISKLAEWRVLKTPQYELYSNEFRRNAETLAARAKEKNLDGAALAYVEMTLTCVRCHKHVREVRVARLD
jgi:hypothetical protein